MQESWQCEACTPEPEPTQSSRGSRHAACLAAAVLVCQWQHMRPTPQTTIPLHSERTVNSQACRGSGASLLWKDGRFVPAVMACSSPVHRTTTPSWSSTLVCTTVVDVAKLHVTTPSESPTLWDWIKDGIADTTASRLSQSSPASQGAPLRSPPLHNLSERDKMLARAQEQGILPDACSWHSALCLSNHAPACARHLELAGIVTCACQMLRANLYLHDRKLGTGYRRPHLRVMPLSMDPSTLRSACPRAVVTRPCKVSAGELVLVVAHHPEQ